MKTATPCRGYNPVQAWPMLVEELLICLLTQPNVC